ncbi:hypothetical protein COU60_03300 [Candidatus Pacearchaeota archaeon CG10_big_fil_rev_8_21_14_0_10_34_76]|nr:MAG: hypothetical protein COU60_03300 [Candidatus Pacearchaeota archaeon CG10_big_fil_rev_8_21_14_0_10_34_76]
MNHHVKHLKRHRNVLYGIVVVLLILQIMTFVFNSSQTGKIISQQDSLRNDLDSNVDEIKIESQSNLEELIKIISQQKTDFQSEINLLKASQADFSGIIDQMVRGVVNIRTEKSVGTGFIVSPSGYIITNHHVIDGSNILRVSTFSGDEYVASVVGVDPLNDLALLKIPGLFDFLEFADSSNIQTGEKVIAIGNPLGLSFTVTEGIVSAVNREGPNGLDSYIQTDVTLNPGNSGGPLINKEGKVIGVNNFKIGGAESLGFALESNVVKTKIEEFLAQQVIS